MVGKHPFAKLKFVNVIYLGAGRGDELKKLTAQLNSKHWHLVEGDATKYNSLWQSIKLLENSDNITLYKNVVSNKGGEKTWYSYNYDGFSGIKRSKSLNNLFPGLRLTETLSVKTDSLANFLNGLELSNEENNLLVIDLPGQALELLESIWKEEHSILFSKLALTVTKDRVFEHGDTLIEVKNWLEEMGYHTRNEPYDDPDFPMIYYSLDKHSLAQINELKKELESALVNASSARQRSMQLEAKLNESLEDNNKALSKITQLEQLIIESENENKRYIDSIRKLDNKMCELRTSRNSAQAKISLIERKYKDLESKLGKAEELVHKKSTKYKEVVNELEHANESLNSLERSLRNKNTELETLSGQLVDSEKSKNMLTKKIESKESEIEQLQQKNSGLGLENLRLIARNDELKKENKMLSESVRRVEIQMGLLNDLIQKD
ncbi:hypothetical protein [Idiomarina sp. UBA3162]|uniref:hypothetical protein n=1 Tax=Idiomarina sp. UBA3162 TaxID=1946641 RepID=UPI000C8EC057|nr:hypothetical protein [Idiomarina sp. UBA3162]MAD52461.1 hypothetical protein [Idiomarinaceae bacterium]